MGDLVAELLEKAVANRKKRDAYEARIAELENTCGRLRTTMVDRKLYEAATNHIEVLEAKIQELQAECDAANKRIAELEAGITELLSEVRGPMYETTRKQADHIAELEGALKLGAVCFTCGQPAHMIVKLKKGGCAAIDISADVYVGLCPQHELTIEPDEPMERIAPTS